MINRYSVMHSGIFGMRHGVRRYQNRDGTWTEEGKAIRRAGGPAATIRGAYDRYKANRPKAKNMSDDELSARINRLRNEKTLKQLQDELYPTVSKQLLNTGKFVWTSTKNGRKIVWNMAGNLVKSTSDFVVDSGTKLGRAFVNDIILDSIKDGKDSQDKEENKKMMELVSDLHKAMFPDQYDDDDDKKEKGSKRRRVSGSGASTSTPKISSPTRYDYWSSGGAY